MEEPRTVGEFRGKYFFLSNFAPYPASYEGRVYPTAEHAFAAAKTLDEQQRASIAQAATPGQAKAMGRKVALRAGWDDMRLEVARQILESKFSDPKLAVMLESTGQAQLVEGNTWNDTFWGVCLGKGQNHLGRLLMELRTRSREQAQRMIAIRANDGTVTRAHDAR